jgi:hypothetical protein
MGTPDDNYSSINEEQQPPKIESEKTPGEKFIDWLDKSFTISNSMSNEHYQNFLKRCMEKVNELCAPIPSISPIDTGEEQS